VTDVVVLGAGLAGLSAARDLVNGGADVLVLEARNRVGGRVEQIDVDEGRPVQLGGEVVGPFHTAYLGLVDELGLSLEPSYTTAPGAETFDLLEGVFLSGSGFPFADAADATRHDLLEQEYAALVATVDPVDPWSHPHAQKLDQLSIGAWARSFGVGPAVIRALEVGALALADGSIERTSLLADLRKSAVGGDRSFYSYEAWESLQVREGSAEVAHRMAAELGERIRLESEVTSIAIASPKCRVTLATGEHITAEVVVSALPVGVLHHVEITGVSGERVESLRRQRMALATKVVVIYDTAFWQEGGASGLAESEGVVGSTWPQHDGTLSILVPPDRIAYLLATPESLRAELVLGELRRMYGDAALSPRSVFFRNWGIDPFARGYVTHWWPGDVMRVGPLHGTHEPPFYVCGSDQWVAGYMEGAVRTGKAAAAAALGSRTTNAM
jgi:monoamine oxidase